MKGIFFFYSLIWADILSLQIVFFIVEEKFFVFFRVREQVGQDCDLGLEIYRFGAQGELGIDFGWYFRF